MKKKTSLKDIAQKVGVSTALVSYVLNDKKTGRIKKELAQKIRDTAIELNYTTNHIARSLKTNKTSTIGLIVADISNTFFSSLARTIEDEAEKKDYTVLFGSFDENPDKSFKLTQVLLNHGVDGLIIAPGEGFDKHITYLQENDVPFVLVDRYLPSVKTNYVAIDNYNAAYTIMRHLIEEGNRRIGFVTFKTALFTLEERKRGYCSALREKGIKLKKSWIREVDVNGANVEVEKAIGELLDLPDSVDAILFTANTLSTKALKYINTLPIEVPKDVAIASFDESDASELFYAPVTHIKQPVAEIGRLATQVLFDAIEKNNRVTQINLEGELVIRKSSRRD